MHVECAQSKLVIVIFGHISHHISPCATRLKYLGDQQEEAEISVSKNAMTNNPLLLAENLVGTYQVWEMGQEE